MVEEVRERGPYVPSSVVSQVRFRRKSRKVCLALASLSRACTLTGDGKQGSGRMSRKMVGGTVQEGTMDHET